jgi:serine/threonine protein kinase
MYAVSGSALASGNSVRWSAPERVGSITAKEEKWVNPTTKSDIYSLAMVIIEVTYQLFTPSFQALTMFTSRFKVFTGQIPFPNAINVNVIIMISRGERPPKPLGCEPLGLGPTVWRLTEECWSQNPGRRPDVTSILRRFQAIIDTGVRRVDAAREIH